MKERERGGLREKRKDKNRVFGVHKNYFKEFSCCQ